MESVTKQMLNFLIKSVLIFLGGLLVSRNAVSQETLDALVNPLVAQFVAIVLIVLPVMLRYFKAQKDVAVQDKTIREAINAEPGTPVSVVKQRVLNQIQGGK